jgi:hypothetical protein
MPGLPAFGFDSFVVQKEKGEHAETTVRGNGLALKTRHKTATTLGRDEYQSPLANR